MINLSGKNIDILGSFVYVYSTDTYMKKNWFKIGGTDAQSVRTRITQQDTTSTAEELIVLRVYELKDTQFYGNSTGAETFLRKGLRRTRKDRDREWRIVNLENLDKKAEKLNKDITKVDIELMYHQIDALDFIKEKFKIFNEVLLFHIPRSGKSYITIKYLSENKFKNVLFLTSFPILNQQWIELINKTKGFEDVIVLNFSQKDYQEFLKDGYDVSKRYIFFVSFQDIKGNGVVLDKEKFQNFKEIEFDLIVIDEVHRGKETQLSDQIFEVIKYKKLLGLSATPTRNLIRGTFSPANTHRVSVEDMLRLKKEHPDEYKNLPSILYYVYNINKLHREELKKFYKEEEYFTWTKFLRVEDGKLKYKNLVRSFLLNHFVGTIGYDNAPIMEFNPTSALIFAEHSDSLELIKDLLETIPLIKENYDVHFTNSKINSSSELMELVEGEFKPMDGKGSIIIANRQLTTGITLKEVDMVVFMNDWSSMDEYIQASYRCLTAMKGKKYGRVIDYLPSRIFNVMYQVIDNEAKVKGVSFEQAASEYFKCTPIHQYDNGFKEMDVDTFMKELIESLNIKNVFSYTVLRSDMINKFHDILENLGNFGETDRINVSKKLDEESDDKGKNKKIERVTGERGEKLDTLKKAIENARYILDRTLLLALYTGFRIENIDDIFEYIKTKEDLINIYLESIMIDDIDMNIIQFIYDNCFDKRIINEKLIFINKIFNDLINEKNIEKRVQNILKIQELINSYLGVSEIEKKKLGEVFTPLYGKPGCVEDQLNLMDETFWKRKDVKVLDPCAGIGNYSVVLVDKFMKGLVDEFPDPEERFKWILEEIIYINEYQSKNLFIYLMIFDPNKKYKMNFNKGDYLKLNIKETFGVDKFDLICMNSPYHEDLRTKKGSAKPMYNLFIEKSIKDSKNIISINPSRWFAGGKGLNDFRKMMLNRNDIKIIQHFNDATKIFGNNIEIKGGVSYFLIDENHNDDVLFNGEYIKLNNFDILPTKFNKNIFSLIKRVEKYKGLDTICIGQGYAGITSNDKRLTDTKINNDDYLVYVSISKGLKKYIKKEYISKNIKNLNGWKVFTARSSTKGGEGFGKYFYSGKPNEICNQSYVVFLTKSEDENLSLIQYLKTNFVNTLLSLRKITQDIKPDTCKWIPIVPFDREWTDEELYEYFELSEDEIKLIEETVK